ncbi:hypothetical protein CEXT_118381 [Caerostris extrusa]|uniref:Uncharacterized protein n=1 Tax=Caerostris extrusa TaxID=172846 RepID=A0AAV4UG03_CAEEX|nr:hypothetical protein CEXT_118381 [Caerostris extrusa]
MGILNHYEKQTIHPIPDAQSKAFPFPESLPPVSIRSLMATANDAVDEIIEGGWKGWTSPCNGVFYHSWSERETKRGGMERRKMSYGFYG